MYGWLVERRVRGVFDALGRQDIDAVLAGLAHDVHHRFAGDHALGGERRGKVVCLHAYEDSQAVARACDVMVAAGIAEAGAPPVLRAQSS